jgi:hypothetical protein
MCCFACYYFNGFYVVLARVDETLLYFALQDHFFSESNGQIGYIQDRLKRLRRSLAPEDHQRPRKNQPKQAIADKQVDCK